MRRSFIQEIKSRLRYNPLRGRKKNRGVALIMAITSLMFLVYIATEVTRDSAVEYIVNSQELNRLKAYYAARNSMQIALLRVKLFQQASNLQLPPGFSGQLDQIWKFPFAWPLPITEDVNAVDRESMQQVIAESFMDASYTHTIEDEGSKIDVNDLASPSQTLRDLAKKQLLTIFEQKINTDDDFRAEYQNTNFEDLVNTIADWMTDSETSASGRGDKRSAYSELGDSFPPNRGFRTIEEMRLVPGMTDVFYDLLAPRITIYGMKAINPNTASKEVLLSLDAGMTDEAVTEAMARRNDPDQGGPFTGNGDACRKDFKDFVESRGARLAPEFDQIPMICDKVFNFRIIATGVYGSGKFALQKNITAVVMDLNRSAQQIKSFVSKDRQNQGDSGAGENPGGSNPDGSSPGTNPGSGSTSSGNTQEPLPKGPPRVIYWTEN